MLNFTSNFFFQFFFSLPMVCMYSVPSMTLKPQGPACSRAHLLTILHGRWLGRCGVGQSTGLGSGPRRLPSHVGSGRSLARSLVPSANWTLKLHMRLDIAHLKWITMVCGQMARLIISRSWEDDQHVRQDLCPTICMASIKTVVLRMFELCLYSVLPILFAPVIPIIMVVFVSSNVTSLSHSCTLYQDSFPHKPGTLVLIILRFSRSRLRLVFKVAQRIISPDQHRAPNCGTGAFSISYRVRVACSDLNN